MPKVRGPLFSISAIGTLGKILTYKKGAAGKIVRNYRKPRGTRNAAQSTVRTWFQRGVWTWQGKSDLHGYAFSYLSYGLEEPARQAWRGFRTTNSSFGYYAFMKRWIQRSLRGLFQYQVPPNFGFCVADEWLANFLYANGRFHDWVSGLPPIPPTPPSSQYVAGIQGLWHFDTNVDPQPDSTGNGNDGVVSGSPVIGPGKFDNAATLNGSDQWFNCGDNSSLQITGALTISFYMKSTDTVESSFVSNWENRAGERKGFFVRYRGDIANGEIYFLIEGVGVGGIFNYFVTSGANIRDGLWHKIDAVFYADGSTLLKVYVDGIEITAGSKVGTAKSAIEYFSDADFYIGRNLTGSLYDGSIDEVAIINRALGSAEILEIYNNNLPLRSEP